MLKVSTNDMRQHLSDTLDRVRVDRERIVVQRNGKDMAALVPVADLALLEALEDAADIKAARRALADPARFGWSEIKGRKRARPRRAPRPRRR